MPTLDYHSPDQEPGGHPGVAFWITYGAAGIVGLVVTQQLDEWTHRQFVGGPSDGGTVCLSAMCLGFTTIVLVPFWASLKNKLGIGWAIIMGFLAH
jgi:hypothetical protein